MVSFTFVVCAEPYKYEAIDTMINLGKAIVKKGHTILGIFLFGSGVYNIKERAFKDTTTRNISNRIKEFSKKNNIEPIACSTWISFTGVKVEEFIEGAAREGLGGLSDLIARSDKVIFFGPGG